MCLFETEREKGLDILILFKESHPFNHLTDSVYIYYTCDSVAQPYVGILFKTIFIWFDRHTHNNSTVSDKNISEA